jgi:hypothetical protein
MSHWHPAPGQLLYSSLFPVSWTFSLQKVLEAGCRWLTPVSLATQEAEIRMIVVQSQPRQIVHETLS